MTDAANRIDRLRETFPAHGMGGFYTEDPIHILYLTGFFAPETGLLVAPDRAVFITDFRTLEEAQANLPGFLLAEVDQGAGTVTEATRRADDLDVDRLGFEAERLPHATACTLIEGFGEARVVPTTGLVEGLRAVKDPKEVEAVEEAIRVAEEAFRSWREDLRPSMTEKEMADRLEGRVRLAGGKKGAFDACVLAGERGSLPHGEPTEARVLGDGEALLVDFGAQRDWYHSDLTRMVYFGPVASPIDEIHEVVRRAQQKAFEAIRPGVPASDVDAAARRFVEQAGYGRAFRHGLGHGVGLQVHEAPRISWLGEAVLAPGMIFTVEPGVYLPGIGGVRIEDMALVTDDGVRVLSSLPRTIEELTVSS
ncbi:MAG: M24 family metallopeptidase, partial [Planctomycetota bacterium]